MLAERGQRRRGTGADVPAVAEGGDGSGQSDRGPGFGKAGEGRLSVEEEFTGADGGVPAVRPVAGKAAGSLEAV